MKHWIPSRAMLLNSLKISLVVGLVLNLINQWPVLTQGSALRLELLLMNFAVPYLVATFSALRNQEQEVFPHYNPNPVAGVSLNDGCIMYANPAYQTLQNRIGLDDYPGHALLPPDYTVRLSAMTENGRSHERWQQIIGDEVYDYRVHAIPDLERAHIYLENVTVKEQSRRQLVWQAYHDELTRLPNRRALTEELEQWLKEDHPLTLGLIWVQGLDTTAVRDGYLAADQIIQTLSERFRNFTQQHGNEMKPDLKVYRFDGYIFALVLCADSPEQQHRQAKDFQSLIEKSLPAGQGSLFLLARLGLAARRPQETPNALIDRANTALHHAQQQSEQRDIIWFDPALGEQVRRQLSLEDNLAGALERQEMQLVYQPQVCLTSGHLFGVEALMRWHHQDGAVSPGEFIPMAERTGMILQLGRWALDTACQQWRVWYDTGQITREFTVAVNVSASELLQPDFVETVQSTLAAYDIPPAVIELEVTESSILADMETGIAILRRLRDLGLQLAIDDFGTGYSSLSYLRQIPAHKLKIDRSFVTHIEQDEQDRLVVRTIIELAHGLGLTVITEGIETDQQCIALRDLHSDQGQGFWRSRPLPANELEHWFVMERSGK